MSETEMESEPTTENSRSRRQLLIAGMAGAAGAAALVGGSSGVAGAADGGPVLISGTNTGTGETLLESTITSGPVFAATATATSTGAAAPGIQGIGVGAGDVKCGGTGRLSQIQALTGNAAPSFAPNNVVGDMYHEIVRSDTGIIWASRGNSADTANRWKRVNAVRVDAADGSGAIFVPTRLIDTRSGAGPIAAGGIYTFQVAGQVGVPADAIAVFGNLTAVAVGLAGYSSSGYLTLFPGGGSQPTVSNVNPAPNGTNAFPNAFFCALGSTGELSIFASLQTHVLVDIVAYVQ